MIKYHGGLPNGVRQTSRDANRHAKRHTRFGCRPMMTFHRIAIRVSAIRVNAIRATALLAILTGSAVLSGQPTALAQEPGFFERIFGNSDRLSSPSVPQNTEVEDRGERPAVAQNRVPPGSGSDAAMRIDRLEAQIRQLTGAIEQLQHRNQQLEAQLRRVLDQTENRSPGARGATVRPVPPA